jgi:hypothetical protein
MVTKRIVFSVSILLFLCGCGATRYSTPPPEISTLKQDQSRSLEISAKGDWRSSGVKIEIGDELDIIAEGRWSLGTSWGGPDGQGQAGIDNVLESYYDDAYPAAGLIGKIGNGKPFFVGKKKRLKSDNNGILYFRINTGNSGLWNNKGFVDVNIKKVQKTISKPLIAIKPETKYYHINNKIHQNWAVIIGISKYQLSGQSGLTNLIFADDDAKAFARLLRSVGWSDGHIKLLINEEATQRNIMIALESWLTKANPNDQIVLFWAGHGFPDPEDPEKVYFACYDTDISIPVTGYRMDRVRAALEERKAKNVIVMADSCHAGKLITRGERGISIVPTIDKMRRERKTPKGWIFMVGADTDRKAIEHSSWTNGAFTHCLIEGLSGKADGYESVGARDGTITMGELRSYLHSAMPDETQRVLGVAKRPVITTSTGDPDIWNLTLQVTE